MVHSLEGTGQMPFSPENISKLAGYHSPEKLALLKRVFDAACEEAAVPQNAKAERNNLAQVILEAALGTELEPDLHVVALKAVATYRRAHC